MASGGLFSAPCSVDQAAHLRAISGLQEVSCSSQFKESHRAWTGQGFRLTLVDERGTLDGLEWADSSPGGKTARWSPGCALELSLAARLYV